MTQSQQPHGEHEQHAGPLVVFFVVFGMLLGGFLREVNKKTKFPYTPMLIVTGLMLGYFRHYLGTIGQSTMIIEKLNPHMILFIFIPVLIFESGFNCDWYVFRKAIVNILILAAPGVLWGAILLGCCFKLLLGYEDSELSWYQAFTLGCVLSATDPVAVVALLKDLGASVRFNTLIQGQSLLNDGTAMVFFMLFLELAKGNSSTAVDVVVNFVRIGLGGPLLGIIMGFLSSLWLKRIVRDDVLTANLTFVSCYLCFYIAQFTWVKVSGILSIVVLGLYMSAVGKTKIYPESEHSLHVIWSYIQYICQTLIFLMTGIIIGVEMIEKSTITAGDWFKMFVFWGLMIVMRFLMVASFYPILRYFGYGLSRKEFVVLVYGGLRGALGLCLALIINVDDSLPTRFRELTVFYMSGMAVLTILVNGLTCSKLVNYVQMIVTPPIKDRLFQICLKKVDQRTRQKMAELKSNSYLNTAEWKKVENMIGMDKATPRKRQMKNLEKHRVSRSSIYSGLNKNEADEEVRFRILRYIKRLIWEQYETGECQEEAANVLSQSIDILLDNTGQKLTLWETVSKNFTGFVDLKLWMKLKDYPVVGNFAKRIILNRVYFVYDASTSLIIACEEAVQQFSEHFPFKKEDLERVFEEVDESVKLAQSYVDELQNTYQMLVRSIHTKKAALNLITEKKSELNSLYEQGIIDDGQYKIVRKDIDDQFLNLQNADFEWGAMTFQELLLECPMFSELSNEERRDLRKGASELTFESGKTILLQNKKMEYAYAVLSGIVRESYGNYKVTRGVGNLLTPWSIVSGDDTRCVLRAQSNCKLLAFKIEVFREMISRNSSLESRVYKLAFICSVKTDTSNKLHSLSQKKLRIVAEKSILTRLSHSQTMYLEFGAYRFHGQLVISQDLTRMKSGKGNQLAVPAERYSDNSNSDKGDNAPSFGQPTTVVNLYESPNMLKEKITVRAGIQSTLLVFRIKLEDKTNRTSRISRIIDEDA